MHIGLAGDPQSNRSETKNHFFAQLFEAQKPNHAGFVLVVAPAVAVGSKEMARHASILAFAILSVSLLLSSCAHNRHAARTTLPTPPAAAQIPGIENWTGELVRTSVSWPRCRQRRNLRHGEADCRASHPSIRNLGASDESGQYKVGGCPHHRPRPFHRRPHHRSLARRGASDRHGGPGRRSKCAWTFFQFLPAGFTELVRRSSRRVCRQRSRGKIARLSSIASTERRAWCCGRELPRSGVFWWEENIPNKLPASWLAGSAPKSVLPL